MQVLYAAMYRDPKDITQASSVDYYFYHSLVRNFGTVEIAGPFRTNGWLAERVFRRAYGRTSGKRYLKWNLKSIRLASRKIAALDLSSKPDVIFTIQPPTIAFYRGSTPTVFVTDLSFPAWQEHGANFGRIPLAAMTMMERRAVLRSERVIVHSEWGKRELVQRHSADPQRIEILPMPSAIPFAVVPEHIDILDWKRLIKPLRLLLVGREFHRKGVDIAGKVVTLLNERGTPAQLTVCGIEGPEFPYVKYVGPFRKSDPGQLQWYTELYRQAHLLLHPARFEPAGIVPGEAAAFGTPTITNDTGGLATTVMHGVSGIVLPKDSPPAAYVQAIMALVGDADRYYALCTSSRRRYETELNWLSAGGRVAEIIRKAV
jgi:glycosyltransferase involved in cell wall biosynthesis